MSEERATWTVLPDLPPVPNFEEANCKNLPVDMFVPDEDAESVARVEHLARRVCATCPVMERCALHALQHERYGVWGGLSGKDRKVVGGAHPRGARSRLWRPGGLLRRTTRAGIPRERVEAVLAAWRRLRDRESAWEEAA